MACAREVSGVGVGAGVIGAEYDCTCSVACYYSMVLEYWCGWEMAGCEDLCDDSVWLAADDYSYTWRFRSSEFGGYVICVKILCRSYVYGVILPKSRFVALGNLSMRPVPRTVRFVVFPMRPLRVVTTMV